MIPHFYDMMKLTLSSMWHNYPLMGKLAAGLNYSGGGVIAVGAVGMAKDSVLGQSLDEWKVYGIIVGACCAVLGLIAQVVFGWLNHRAKQHRRRMGD